MSPNDWSSEYYGNDEDEDRPDHICPAYIPGSDEVKNARWLIIECEACGSNGKGHRWMQHWCDWEPWKTEPPSVYVHGVCETLAVVTGSIVEEP